MTDDPQRELKLWLAEKVAPHGTITRLVEATGIDNTKITRMKELGSEDPKKRRRIQEKEVELLARFFRELPPGYEERRSWLEPKVAAHPESDFVSPIPLTPQPQKGGRPDLAVRGIAMGGSEGQGDFELNGGALDFIARPAGLIGRPNAFAVILRNVSMEPVYKHGWPIFVDPDGRKPVEGEDVLLELFGEDPDDRDNGPAFIKTLVRQRGGQIVLSQYNPVMELSFDARRKRNLYRVIPYPEAMGLAV